MAINNHYRLTVVGQHQDGSVFVNTFAYRQVAETPPGELSTEQLILAWREDAEPEFRVLFTGLISIVQYKAASLSGLPEQFEILPSPAPAGTQTGETVPPQVTIETLWLTGLPGRRNRGKSYFWPVSEQYNDSGVILPAFIANIDAFATAAAFVQVGALGLTFQQAVWSSVNGAGRDVIGHKTIPRFRTQRRRTLGFGS